MKTSLCFHPAAFVPIAALLAVSVARADLEITTYAIPSAMEETAFSTTLEASGGTEPYSWAVAPKTYAEMSAQSTFAETGTAQNWHADDSAWDLVLPFSFPFFGATYTTARISSNGWIAFGETVSSYFDPETPSIAVLAGDLRTDVDDCDVFVESDQSAVTIRWKAVYYDLQDSFVNVAATLRPDGTIALSYGSGNGEGGTIAVSEGAVGTNIVSALSQWGPMGSADDIVFSPVSPLPAGVSLSSGGTLAGTPAEPGEYPFTAVVTDDDGSTASADFVLSVAENPALRPSIVSVSPDEGDVDVSGLLFVSFSVTAVHPDGGALAYAWTVDDEPAGTESSFELDLLDGAVHDIVCTVSGAGLSKTASAEWKTWIPLRIDTDAELPDAMTGEPFSQGLSASGGVPPYAWTVGDDWPYEVADGWYVEAYGEIYIDAEDDEAGTYELPVRVADAEGNVAEKTFTVVVAENPNHAPVFTSVSPKRTDVYVAPGASIAFEAVAVDSDGDDLNQHWEWYDPTENECRYDYDAGSSFSLSDLQEGDYSVEVYVSDENDRYDSRSCRRWWNVHVGDYLVIDTEELPEAPVGLPYEATLSAHQTAGDAGTLTWSAYDLPEGLSLSEAGVLSGTPTEPGDYTVGIGVAASGGEGLSAYAYFDLHVDSGTPRISDAMPAQGPVNLAGVASQPFSVTASSSIDAPLSYEWLLDGEPVGADASSFVYAHDSSDLALHTLRCIVTADGVDGEAEVEWTLGVLSATDPADVTVAEGGTAVLSVSVSSSAAATVEWYRDGRNGVLARGPVLRLADVRRGASYHAVVTSLFGSVETASATVTVTPRPAGDKALVVTEIADVTPGRVVRELSALGTRVAWNEGSAADKFTLEMDVASGKEEHYAYTWDESAGRSVVHKEDGPVSYSLQEWDGGYRGAIVAEEDLFLGSTFCAPAFRPLVTADGLYYVTDPEYWKTHLRFLDAGGRTVTAHSQYVSSFIGDDFDFREMESGRVFCAWAERNSGSPPRKIVDMTDGGWTVVAEPDYLSWETSSGTSYYDTSPLFLPNALSWQSDGVLNDETGWIDATRLVVLPDDGTDVPVVIAGATNATLCARGDDSLLWTEFRGDKTALVLSDGSGGGRRTLRLLSPFDAGPSVSWDFETESSVTNESVRIWSVPDPAAGLTAGGDVFYERVAAGGTAKELVLVDAGDFSETVLDATAWSTNGLGGRSPFAAVFSAQPYRGGLAWLRPTGGTNASGRALAELRVRLGDPTFTAASDILLDAESVGASGWGGRHFSTLFSRQYCRLEKLVFVREESGTVQLCVWDGQTADAAPTVLASGFESFPYFCVNVNERGAAAAVNVGTENAPHYKVFVAYETGDAPQVIDLPSGTELVDYSTRIFEPQPGIPGSLVAGGGRGFGLDSDSGCLTGCVAKAGTYDLRIKTDDTVGSRGDVYRLVIEENPNRPPVLGAVTPAPGAANFGAETQLVFSVTAHDPEAGALVYRWFVDEEEQAETGASFTLLRETGDVSAHNVRCVVEDDLWTEETAGSAVRSVEWNAGVLAIVSAEAPSVHTGQKPRLSVVLESTVEFYGYNGKVPGFDATTWYDAATDEEVAVGNTVLAPADGSGTYYAVTRTQYGSVRTEDLTVSIDPSPLAGRIYNRSGAPALVGNRCILHAGAWGEGELSFSWTRDGTEVSTARTLGIAALSKEDFGTYVFTVRNEAGEEDSSPPFRLAPAPSGTVVGWTYDDTDGILPPPGIGDAVQIAASSYGGVALRRNGTVAAWSAYSDENGLADGPPGLSGVQQVAARRDWDAEEGTMAALKRDGSVLLWGYDEDDFPFDASLELGDVVQIALMYDSLVVLRANGTVARTFFEWYDDDNGWDRHLILEEEEGVTDAVGVFAGTYYHAILHEDGSLSGDCTAGGAADLVSVGGELDSRNWLAVAEDGSVFSSVWYWSTLVESVTDAIAADAQFGSENAFLLTSDGTVHRIGYDSDETPAGGTRAFAVSCGAGHTLAIVADTDVDVEDAGLLDVLENAGLVEDAGAASEMELVRTASADFDGDGMTAWAEYVAGTDPTDETKVFRADIAFENDVPVVTWDPDLGAARDYAIEAADELGGAWTETTADEIAADGADVRFFRVKVALPDPDGN